MPQLTLTTAGRTALAAASGASQINIDEVRLGTGRLADSAVAAATALQTPIPAAVYAIGAPSGQRSAVVAAFSELAYTMLCTEAGDAGITPTEMGMFDSADNMIAYFAAAAGSNIFNKPAGVGNIWRFIASVTFDNPQSTANFAFSVGAVLPATATLAGIVELATNAEAIAGTDATRAMTPAADKAALNARVATQALVDAGTDNTHFVTPQLLADNAGGGVDVQDFEENGVWTKPEGAVRVYIELWGGGAAGGIGDGGGGDYGAFWMHADKLNATENVYVGPGGTVASLPSGGDGGDSFFISDPHNIAAFGGPSGHGGKSAAVYVNTISRAVTYERGGERGLGSQTPTLENNALRWYAGTARIHDGTVYTPSKMGFIHGCAGYGRTGSQANPAVDGNKGHVTITTFTS